MALNDSKLLQMAPNESEWLEIAQNDSKLLEIAWNGSKSDTPLKKMLKGAKKLPKKYFLKS